MTDFIDFKTVERPAKPNTYLLAPLGYCGRATPDANSPVFDEAPDALFARVVKLAEEKKGWGNFERSDKTRQLSFVARTALLRFKDDIDILVLPEDGNPGHSRIAIYSRSRLGYSDLGANRKRVAEFIHTLTSN